MQERSFLKRPSTYIVAFLSLAIGSGGGYLVGSHYRDKRIDELSASNKKMVTELRLSKEEVAALQKARDELESEYNNAIARGDEGTRELQDARERLAALQKARDGLESAYNRLESERDGILADKERIKQEYGRLKRELAELQEARDEMEDRYDKDLEKRDAEANGLCARIDDYNQRIQEYESKLSRFREENRRLKERYGVSLAPKDIVSLKIDKGDNIWSRNKEELEKEMGFPIDDQPNPDGTSKDAAIFLKGIETDIGKNSPPQPPAFQDRLGNLDLVYPGDVYNVDKSRFRSYKQKIMKQSGKARRRGSSPRF
jgi:seryl-tRNA synthetase